jgi:uncharacterized protein (DUF488 family)
MPEPRAFTVGHSTHSLSDFVVLLRGAGIEAIADVRAHPGSRRMPHFNRAELERSLPETGLGYEHFPELGGRRRALSGSPNAGWEVEAFRAYADHMASAEFDAGLTRLETLARDVPVVVMCAEGLWWRCHRRLVADALVVRGWEVVHIAPDGGTTRHELPDFAVVDDGRVSYPPAQGELPGG